MTKRKILFINDSIWSGSGVFRSLQQILNHLNYEKYNVTLFITPGAIVEPQMQALMPPEINVIIGEDHTHYYRNPLIAADYVLAQVTKRCRMKKPAAFFQRRSRQRIREKRNRAPAITYFKDELFDVVVANTVPSCAEIAWHIRAKKKYVLFRSSRAEFFPAQTRQSFAVCTGVIAVSQGVAQMLRKAYPAYAEKVLTIPNYVDADAVLKMAADPYSPPDNRLTICSCGRLSREKGFDLAVEAARILKAQGVSFFWFFVGDGEARPTIENRIAQYGLQDSIRITGILQNPFPYISHCDIYVQPSREESYGRTIMEALILGKAVVSTETVGSLSIIRQGETGILTPISAQGLADGILPLTRDPLLRSAMENKYTTAENLNEKKAFSAAWNDLLSE